MLLTIFIPTIYCADYCKAKHNIPTPMADKKLRFISIVTDPGLLTPRQSYLKKDKLGVWNCNEDDNNGFRTRIAPSLQYRHYHQVVDPLYAEYPKNCRWNDLTVQGRKNSFELGEIYRTYLVNNLKHIPEKMNPRIFRFFSAPDDCSFHSAQSFLNGFYPPLSDNEILSIETADEKNSPLMVSQSMCNDLNNNYKQFIASEKYQTFYNEAKKVTDAAVQSLGVDPTPTNTINVCKWAMAMSCNDESTLPKEFTKDVLQKCLEVSRFETLSFYLSNSTVAAAPFFNHFFKYSDKAIGLNMHVKVNYQAARNNVIAAICSLIKYEGDIPIGSHLAIEIWEDSVPDQYIRFVLNGDEIFTQRYDNFRTNIESKIEGVCSEQDIYDE